ncbi:MAG: hypothetical protein ACOCXY_03155 [Planctomycetota bacterium]
MAENCQTCGCRMSSHKNRYCGECAKQVRAAMRRAGYLQSTYVPPYFSDERGRKGMRNMVVVGGAPY